MLLKRHHFKLLSPGIQVALSQQGMWNHVQALPHLTLGFLAWEGSTRTHLSVVYSSKIQTLILEILSVLRHNIIDLSSIQERVEPIPIR
jgi:hypothetical protein